jgi:hypothetical protein
MSPEIWGAIIGAIIGGLLATGSGVFLNYKQFKTNRKNMKEIFFLIIEDDLNSSIPLYDQIKEIGRNQKYVSFEALNEIRYSRKIYEKYIEHVAFIEPCSLRKKIFDYYLKSGALIDKLENFQRIIYTHQEAIKDTKRFIALNKKEEQVSQEVLDGLTSDNKDQINFFFNAIQAEVGNLDNFKVEAQFILQELRMLKNRR